MNPFRIFSVFRKGNEFVDAVKSGKQVAITAALGALLTICAPILGSQLNVHPWLAFFFTPEGIQALGALITAVAGIVYHFGSSAERGILPAKPDAPVPAAPAEPPAGAPAVAAPAPGLQRAPDAVPRQDAESMRAGG